MNDTKQKILDLQAAGEDAEWFPTTQAILTCIKNDLLSYGKDNYNYRYSYWAGDKLVEFRHDFENQKTVFDEQKTVIEERQTIIEDDKTIIEDLKTVVQDPKTIIDEAPPTIFEDAPETMFDAGDSESETVDST